MSAAEHPNATVTVGHHVVAAMAGAVAANVVPHLAHAVAGEPFPTPFADPPGKGDSSPALNAAWSSMNAAGAAALLYTQRARLHRPTILIALGAGATAAAVGLRSYFAGLDR